MRLQLFTQHLTLYVLLFSTIQCAGNNNISKINKLLINNQIPEYCLVDPLFKMILINLDLSVYESNYESFSNLRSDHIGTVNIVNPNALEFNTTITGGSVSASLIIEERNFSHSRMLYITDIEDHINLQMERYIEIGISTGLDFDEWLRPAIAIQTFNSYILFLKDGYQHGWIKNITIGDAINGMDWILGLEINTNLEKELYLEYDYPVDRAVVNINYYYDGNKIDYWSMQFLNGEGLPISDEHFEGRIYL